ncbi:uncharacterized protein E0L32_008314 [Thyridium curvatum]|uniref:RRM domain-containing protein n=1 Tax=Thyridium curvatum TaxID=1093900 RepID=A0A507AK22_9PEZI|nr:uncharacterized protein E0L32_008314 [Thyridium curvatum]TPX10745.1 hypothetical protein E0L32_008314 [Thyridium curvatum]
MASQVIIACGTNIAPVPPTYQIPGGQVLNFDSNAFMQETGMRTVYVMDHHGNWMADAPAELYLNMPPDMAATFSTGMGAEPKKILKDLLPAGRKLVRWSADDMWERARVLRARWPDAVNGMFNKPQAWADLFQYYDSEDLYFLGALNVWNLVNLIVKINLAMTERELQSKLFQVQNWVEDWMTWEGNRMMLECWEPTQSQNILVILSDYDRKEGGCGDFQHYEDEQLLKLTLEKRYAEWINTGSHGNYVQSWLDSTDSPGKTTSPPPLDSIPEGGVPLPKARVFGRVVSAPVSGLRWDMTESVSAPRSSSAQLTGVTNEGVTNEDVTNEDETEQPLGDITSQALNVEVKPETKTEFEQGIKAFISASAPASPALTQESSMDSNKENCPPSAPATVPSAEGLTINVLADVDNVAGQPSAVNTITQPEMAGLYIRQTQDHSTAINTHNSVPPTAQPGTNSMQQDWSQFSGGFASYMKQPPAPASVNDTGPRGYSYAGRASNTTAGGPPPHGDLQRGATNLQNQPVTQYATVENARGLAGVPPPQVQSARTASGFTDRSLSFGQPQGKSPPRSAGWQPKYYDVLHGRVYTREGGGTAGTAASSQSSYRHTTPPRGNTGRSLSERPSPPGCANAGRRGIMTNYVACYCKRCGPRQRAVFVSKLSDALDLKHPRVQANIRDYFSEFGQVDRIEAHEMKQNVFVFFKTEAGAHAAINRGHRHPIKGLSDDALCVNYPVFSQFFRPRYVYQGHVPNYHSTKNTDRYRPQRPSQKDRSQKYYPPPAPAPAPAQYDAYHEPAPTGYEKRWPSNSQSRHPSPSRAQVHQFQQPGYELPLGKTRQGPPPAAGPAGDARAATYSYPGVGGYSAGCAPQDSQPYYPPYQAGLSNMGMPPPNAFRQPDVQPPAMVPAMTGPYMPGEQPVYYPPPAENYAPNTNFDYPAPQLAQPVIKFPPKEDMGAFGARANRRKSDSAMTTPTKPSKGKKKFKKPARAGRALSDQQDSGSAKDSAEESMMGTVIRRKPVPKASILPSAAAVTSSEDSMEENSMRTVIRRKPVPKPSILPSAAAATFAENYVEEIDTGTVIRRKPVPRPRILPSAAAATAAEESTEEENDTGTVIRRKPVPKASILPSAAAVTSAEAKSTRLTSLPKGFDPFPRMSSHRKLPSTSGAPATVHIEWPPPKGKAPATPPNKAPAVAPTPSPEQKIVVNEATPPQAIKANPPAEYRTPSPAAARVVRRAASDPDVAATRASSSKRPALTQSTLQALGKTAKATPMNLTSPTKQDATKLVVNTPSEAKSRETSYETAKTHLSPESSPGEGSDRSAAALGKGKQKQELQPAGSGSPARQARPFPSRPSTPTATTTGTQTVAPMQGNNDNGSSSMAWPTKTSPSRAAVKKWKSPAKDAGPSAGSSKAPTERPAKSWARYTSKASAPAFNMSNFPALPVNKTRDASDATQAARVRAWAEKRKMKEEVLSPTEASASGSDKE